MKFGEGSLSELSYWFGGGPGFQAVGRVGKRRLRTRLRISWMKVSAKHLLVILFLRSKGNICSGRR